MKMVKLCCEPVNLELIKHLANSTGQYVCYKCNRIVQLRNYSPKQIEILIREKRRKRERGGK